MNMVTMTRRALAALSLAVAVPLVVAGQQRPERDDPALVFRTGVELINVTATVTDARGRFVVDGVPASDVRWMTRALEMAELAASREEVPVGAVLTKDDEIVAEGHNLTVTANDPTAHAEMVVIREAAQTLGDWRLTGCTLYVTLEPCAMCAGALVLSRLKRLVFGASDPKAGMVGSLENLVQDKRLNHMVEVTSGTLADATGDILQDFFRARRGP